MTNQLDKYLTEEQQNLLARHLADRLGSGFGEVILQIEKSQVKRIGQRFLDDAVPERLAGPVMPAVSPVARKRR